MKTKKDNTGKSDVQQNAEGIIRKLLVTKIGTKLHSSNIPLDEGVKLQVDACNKEKHKYYEIYSRQGKINPGQQQKISRDILKLLLLRQCLPKSEIGFVYASMGVHKYLHGHTWVSKAVKIFKIKLINFENKIPCETRRQILVAEQTQAQNRR